MGNAHLLLIDDDEKFCRLTTKYLNSIGYQVTSAHLGTTGLMAALQENFQAVILDVMLPDMDGFEVLREIRANSKIPILMLTARGEEPDRIVGLEMGADDYLPKTFSPREILARLRAVLRRTESEASDSKKNNFKILAFGDLIINGKLRTVSLHGQTVRMTNFEFDLLYLLAENAGLVMPREEILDRIAGREYSIFDRAIDVHVSSLRQKLMDNPKNPRYIRTIRSIGYMFAQTGQGK